MPIPVLPHPVIPPPVLPDPVLPVPNVPNNLPPQDSDDEFVDAEELAPDENNARDPDAVAIVPAAHGPPIAAFRPRADAPLAQETFQLPCDIRPNPYNLRERKDKN